MASSNPQRAGVFNWIVGKYGDLIPLLAFLAVLAGVYVYDQQSHGQVEVQETNRQIQVTQRAAYVAEELSSVISERVGALAAAELQFTPVEDSVSNRTFAAALDSVINKYPGLTAMSVITRSGVVRPGQGALLGAEGMRLNIDTAVGNAFQRARQTRKDAATGVVNLANRGVRRVVVFDPVESNNEIIGYLAGELDPAAIYRNAITRPKVADTLRSADIALYHAVYGPNNVLISTQQMNPPSGYLRVDRAVRVADTEWNVQLAYEPIDASYFQMQRFFRWVIGIVLALALAIVLMLLRSQIKKQHEEIRLRQAAEEAARTSAGEARQRMRESRELASQLEAAQHASQRLSTSLNPDDVVELFLGSVAEIMDADVASLYTFEEEGEVVVGRRRIVFHNVGPVTARLQHEDIRQVRAPVSMLPTIAEAVASGEPYVDTGEMAGHGRPIPAVAGGAEAAAVS
ncbi:MAG TPA: hypothetical protein VGD49_13290, partial [Longimicrobiales bacterium]